MRCRKRSVCREAVDPQPSKPLRDWLTLTEEERCRACDEEAGDDARRLIELQASSKWEQS
jgi:hypothetical protein